MKEVGQGGSRRRVDTAIWKVISMEFGVVDSEIKVELGIIQRDLLAEAQLHFFATSVDLSLLATRQLSLVASCIPFRKAGRKPVVAPTHKKAI